MRIRQIRFDGWGSLSGQVTLDPERLALMVVDTDRERNDLVAALEALVAAAPVAEPGRPGRLMAEMELDPRDGAQPDDGERRVETGWRNLGEAGPPAATGTPATRLEVLAGRRATPWLVDGEDLASYTDLADLVSWIRVWADSTAGYRSAEDVRMVLNSGLIAFPGMLVDSGPLADELTRLDQALERIAAEAGSLEEDRRHAAAALAALAHVRKQIAGVEGPLVALEQQEVRSRHGQLCERVEAHRKAHARLKALRREATQLADMARFPAPSQIDGIEALLATWVTGRGRMEQLDEQVADLKGALDRCATAGRRRAWAAGAFPDVARTVETLVGRFQRVSEKLGEQTAVCDAELGRRDEAGAVEEFARLDARVREVPAEDRDFVVQSFPSVLEQFFQFVSMSSGLKTSQSRLGMVRSLQVRISLAAFVFIAFGLAAAIGVPVSQYNDTVEMPEAPYLVAGGAFMLMLGSALWFSAGGFLSKRRVVLETQVAGLVMPIELEGLRLSVVELKMEEICRKFGYDCGEDMARDLVRYGALAHRPLTRAWQESQARMREIRAAEVEPLAREAGQLLRSYPFPLNRETDSLAELVHVWHELRTWTVGAGVSRRLEEALARTLAERDELEPAQTERLASLRRSLSDAGVKADPGAHPTAALVELRTRRRRYERWLGVRTREIPRVGPLLMRPAELARVERERRRVARFIVAEALDPALTPQERQLARRLTVARRRLAALRERERALTADARARLSSYHRRLPALLERRTRLLGARERALTFQKAIDQSLSELDQVTSMVRPGVAKHLNAEAIPRWVRFRPTLEGVRFEADLALSLPYGSDRQTAQDARLAHLAVRAALAQRCGPNGMGCPLVLVEPFEKAAAQELGAFVNFLVTQLCPAPQVIIVSRRRSRYERVRWEQPLVFKRIQIIEVRPQV